MRTCALSFTVGMSGSTPTASEEGVLHPAKRGRKIIEAWRRGEESVRATIEEREAGGYTVHRGERVEVYDGAALLIQTIDPVMVINYRYNEQGTDSRGASAALGTSPSHTTRRAGR